VFDLLDTTHTGIVPQSVGRHNRISAFMRIRQAGKLSRGGLSRLMGLSLPSISSIINDLLSAGLIVETDMSLARSEPRSLLAINPEWGCVVCVSMTSNLAVGVVDLAGNVLSLNRVAGDGMTHGLYRERFDALLLDAFRAVMDESHKRKVLGVGVLSGGYVDDTGIVRYNGNLPRRDVDMKEVLHPLAPAPVCVEEENRLLLLSKMWGPQWEGWRNAVALNPGWLGCGGGHALALNGRLYSGRRGMAGIDGQHLLTSPDGDEWMRLSQAVRRLGSPGEYLERIRANDPAARQALEAVVENYARRLAQVASFISPDVVFVYHPYSDCAPDFLDRVRQKVSRYASPMCIEGMEVRFGGRRSDEERIAAAALPVLSHCLTTI